MFDILSVCLFLWKTSSLHLLGLRCIKLLLDHSKNLFIIPAPKSLFLKTGATVVQSPTYLKQIVSSPILIDKSFRKMLNKYEPLIFPSIVPINASLIYLLLVTDNVIIYHPLCLVMWKIQPPIDYIYGFREMSLSLFAVRLWSNLNFLRFTCPSASFALQIGDFVPRDCSAVKGPLHTNNYN